MEGYQVTEVPGTGTAFVVRLSDNVELGSFRLEDLEFALRWDAIEQAAVDARDREGA